MQVAVAAQLAVAHIHKAGTLHHKGVDLLDSGVGIAALALALGGGVDDAVQGLGQQDHRADDQRCVGILGIHIITHKHGQGQDDTGAGTARSGGHHDYAHGLLHLLAVLAEQVVNGVVQRLDMTGLDGGVQS